MPVVTHLFVTNARRIAVASTSVWSRSPGHDEEPAAAATGVIGLLDQDLGAT